MLFILSKKLFRFSNIQSFVFPNSPQFFSEVYDISICLNKNLITILFDILRRKKDMTLKLDRVLRNWNIFMEKSCRNYEPKASSRPLLNFDKLSKTATACKK